MKQILRYGAALLFALIWLNSYSQTTVTVTISTDCWGGEVSWNITDSQGTIMASVPGNTMGNNQTYNTAVTLADGCYTFAINDSYGDGMNGSIYGGCGINGNYYLTDEFGTTLVQMTAPNAAYGSGTTHCFCVGAAGAGCTDPEANNFDPCVSVDDGSCTYDPPVADFSFTSDGSCIGSSYSFTDLSGGGIVTWEWTFANGTPSTSSDQNPVVTFNTPGTHEVSLLVTDVNGMQDLASASITVSAGNALDIIINPDNYPNEISWELVDNLGAVVASGGSTGTSLCINDECHIFTIYDSYGDGICCGYGQGSYSIVLNGTEVATGGNYANQESVYVNCAPGIDCNNTIEAQLGVNTTPEANSWYTFTPAQNGQYRIGTCGLAGCNTTIWMYDYCNMANFDDTNEATLTYNDDLCGVEAEVTPYLEGGTTYYIRVGSLDGSCGSNIDFVVEYMGGIPGCMDQAACNYLPIATEPTTCFYPGDPQCPDFGPDLEILGDVFYSSMYMTTLNNNDACYVNEGCMQGFGSREIIRFTTHIKNIGTEDYFIGAPSAQPGQFEWDVCHNHWHYEGYAEYVLYDENGLEMPQIGFKNGFCVLDLECSGGGQAKYTCGNMGITAGCGDIYSSGLSCQWVDITDVPAGSYTMVVRTNWDFSPDANGSYELRYDNNWAAVCITFDRDPNTGAAINFTKSLDCPVIVDCVGQPFGNTMPDCAGNCPGLVVKGDVDASGELQYADADQYVQEILGNDAVVSPCTDMDGDGEISVSDVALIAGCVFYGPDHVDNNGVHDHCIFNGEITNPNHNVTLSIGDVNTTAGYVDVHILNPDNKVVAYEFSVSGITISSVENLYDPLLFDATPAANLGGTKVMGYTQDDVQLPKNYTPTPFVRIYYLTSPGPDVCISAITDVVNEDYHNVVGVIGDCMPLAQVHFADFEASSTTVCVGESVTFTDLSGNAPTEWAWNFQGGTPAFSNDQNPVVTYATPGTYDVTLTSGNGGSSDSETKIDYITVVAPNVYYADADQDGYGDAASTVISCSAPTGYVENDQDCDDTDNTVYPGAPELCDNKDNDCNGQVDDNPIDMTVWYVDADNDGFGNDNITISLCWSVPGVSSVGGDCDDNNASVYPGAPGTNAGVDNDCNGTIDPDEVFECMGDLNDDLIVNVSDLLVLLSDYGCIGLCVADLNNDGTVNTGDQVIFLSLYGTTCE